MENAVPYEPDYGVCYCGFNGRMVTTEDGTVYCTSPQAQVVPDARSAQERPCRDSANNAVAGPRLLLKSGPPNYREDRSGMHEPRVCVFIGSSFKDSHTETVLSGNQTVRVRARSSCVG